MDEKTKTAWKKIVDRTSFRISRPSSWRSGRPSSIGVLMGQEIELKLSIHPGDISALHHHPLIELFSDGPPIKKRLNNTYYDTSRQTLRRHAMALRIRFDGDNYIQTLKQKGKSRDGLTVRGEWEWPVDRLHLRTDLVPTDILPKEVRGEMGKLVPVFRTDFERMLWTLRIPTENRFDLLGPAVVEMVLDQGEVVSCGKGSGNVKILEVELELVEGRHQILYRISDLLKESIRIEPSNISKAHRGYKLLDGS